MDPAFLRFVGEFVETCGPFERVLELGALNVTGTIRPAFKASKAYVGLDMRPGPDVDVVANAVDLDLREDLGTFDCIAAICFFEHDARFWLTLRALRFRLRSKGWLVLTVPIPSWPVHNHPGDYYRFTPQAVREILMDGYEHVVIRDPVVPTLHPVEVNQNIGAWGQKP